MVRIYCTHECCFTLICAERNKSTIDQEHMTTVDYFTLWKLIRHSYIWNVHQKALPSQPKI